MAADAGCEDDAVVCCGVVRDAREAGDGDAIIGFGVPRDNE